MFGVHDELECPHTHAYWISLFLSLVIPSVFRCLDVDYLILKTFLLERFLHDFIFESMSPNTVREFLGVL